MTVMLTCIYRDLTTLPEAHQHGLPDTEAVDAMTGMVLAATGVRP
jgi:hypothetical protein